MGDLIAAAAQRKLYLEKAKDRRLQKERELEKDIYGDKEQFVTEAYLEKQRELQRLEMEEKMREEQEADPRRPRNLALFYSSIDSKHQVDDKTIAQLKDYERAKENAKLEQDKQTKLKIEQGLVQVNESGEIIDNLQLLQGGINAPIRAKMIPKEDLKVNEQQSTDKKEHLKRVQTAAAQKSEHIKQKEHQKETQEKDLQSKLKSSLDKESIMSAKERFLQRKRQRENANVITITPQTKNKLHHEECD
jgi:coiled-coil domain-containing protein 55